MPGVETNVKMNLPEGDLSTEMKRSGSGKDTPTTAHSDAGLPTPIV